EAPPTASTEEITRDYIPYLYNYQLQLYADSFYEFCETIKDAANNSDGAAKDYMLYYTNLQDQVEELQGLAAEVDSISDPDPISLDDYIDNKTRYAKIAIDQIKDAKVRESYSAVLDSATFKSSDFKIYEYND